MRCFERVSFLAIALAALIGTVPGCTPDFDEIWQVNDLRILALNADPPEILLRSFVIGDSLPAVEISALATDPRDFREEQGIGDVKKGPLYRWELWQCTPEEGTCRDAALSERIHRAETPLSDISYRFTPSEALVRAAFAADPFRGFGGLPLIVELRIEDRRGGPSVRAAKRIVYTVPLPYSPIPDRKQANKNPVVEDLLIDELAPDNHSTEESVALRLTPRPESGAQEPYVVIASRVELDQPELEEIALEEFLAYSFFTTGGRLSHSRTGGAPSLFFEDRKATDISSVWTIAASELSDARLWIVIRDDRGGVSWKSFKGSDFDDGRFAPTQSR